MKLWTDWIRTQDDAHCPGPPPLDSRGFHFADWLALDNPVQGIVLRRHRPATTSPPAYYFNAGKDGHSRRPRRRWAMPRTRAEYARLADEIKAAFRREYFTDTGRIAAADPDRHGARAFDASGWRPTRPARALESRPAQKSSPSRQ